MSARDLIQLYRGNYNNLVGSLAQAEGFFDTGREQFYLGGVSGDVLIKQGKHFNIDRFGAQGDGATDDTQAVLDAIELMSEGDVLSFTGGKTYSIGKITLTKSIFIDGGGASLIGNGNCIFSVETNLDFIHIYNFNGVTFAGALGASYKEFFVNAPTGGVYGANLPSFPDNTNANSIKDLQIYNNALKHGRVVIGGGETVPRIYNNTWIHNSVVIPYPCHLYVGKGDSNPTEINDYIIIEKNIFDVWLLDSGNVDIIKISGGTSSPIIDGNYVKNNNPNALAQIDVFRGGNKARFVNNNLTNVQYHRKQTEGTSGSHPEISYDLIQGNVSLLENGHLTKTAYYIVGSLFSILNNQVYSLNTDPCIAFQIDNNDVVYDDFGTTMAVAFIINNNLVNFKNASIDSDFIVFDIGDNLENALCSISNNVYLGGERFVNGQIKIGSLIGNVWGYSDNAEGTSFVNGNVGTIAIGNVADTDVPTIVANTQGNRANENYGAIDPSASSTPSVERYSTYNLSGTGTLTDLLDAPIGKVVTLFGLAGSTTLTHSSHLRLSGSVDAVVTANSSITLKKSTSTEWIEISRSIA